MLCIDSRTTYVDTDEVVAAWIQEAETKTKAVDAFRVGVTLRGGAIVTGGTITEPVAKKRLKAILAASGTVEEAEE